MRVLTAVQDGWVSQICRQSIPNNRPGKTVRHPSLSECGRRDSHLREKLCESPHSSTAVAENPTLPGRATFAKTGRVISIVRKRPNTSIEPDAPVKPSLIEMALNGKWPIPRNNHSNRNTDLHRSVAVKSTLRLAAAIRCVILSQLLFLDGRVSIWPLES